MVAALVLPAPAAVGDEWGNALNVAVQSVNADVEALKVRSIAAGLGLTGGGDLSQNRSIAVDFAASGVSSATKAVRADDSRLSNARTPTAHTHVKADVTDFAHGHAQADVTNLVTDLAAKAPTTRTITAGTGLTGGGDLSANRTLAINFATATPLATSIAGAVGTATKAAPEDHVHPWAALGPTAVTNGGSMNAAGTKAYTRNGTGFINLNITTTGAVVSGATLFTVPAGYRPAEDWFVELAVGGTGSGEDHRRVHMRTDGTAQLQGTLASGLILRAAWSYPLAVA